MLDHERLDGYNDLALMAPESTVSSVGKDQDSEAGFNTGNEGLDC
jgi:hypothetical protein